MRDLKNAIEKGTEELERRETKTAAEMKNHDMGEFLQPKQVPIANMKLFQVADYFYFVGCRTSS